MNFNCSISYSSSKSIECTSAGNLFFFLRSINGFFKRYEIVEANTKPLDSIAATLSKLILAILII